MPAYALPSQLSDAYLLAPDLRQADKDEIYASTGDAPIQALVEGVQCSDQCLTIWDRDRPLGMFGLAHHEALPGVGLVWMVATDALPTIIRDFVRQTPLYLSLFHSSYRVLGNFVDERNAVHIKWLKRVGFTFINRHPKFGFEGRPFLEFCKHV